MKPLTDPEERTRALLKVAAYLGQPQKFMAVAEARAELRHTLELASKGSVILTAHGQPEAAVVPFTTLEDIRRALLHLLVEEMEAGFARTQKRLGYEGPPVIDEELSMETEKDVIEVLRAARKKRGKPARKVSRV